MPLARALWTTDVCFKILKLQVGLVLFAYGRLSDVNKTEATDVQHRRPSIEQLDAERSLGCLIM